MGRSCALTGKLGAFFAPLFLVPGVRAQGPKAVSPVRPLQTELIVPLDISRVRVGSPVLVRVDVPWSESNCTLKAGSIVQGHITGVVKRSKSVRDSSVQLGFEAADCEAHHEAEFPFTLVALIGGSAGTGQSGVSEAPPLADAIGNAIGGAGGGIRSASTASAINANAFPVRPMPTQILPGQVMGIRKTVLHLGTAPGEATTITAQGHDLRLEQGTSLILTQAVMRAPESGSLGASVRDSTAGARGGNVEAPAAASVVVPPPAVPDESEICSSACNVAGDAGAGVVDSPAAAVLGLRQLGYSPRESRELHDFDRETTLTFLDEGDLLCTFDPHHLRERDRSGEEAVRNIRAVLVDSRAHTIKRVMEWRVRGDEEYLWRLTGGRVLVHIGHELKLFSAELKPLRAVRVEGPVAWVVSSPSGDHIAVGTVIERHSAAVHRDLDALSPEPEEDVEIRVFDKDFAVVATAVRSSRVPRPVLSESGELRLAGDGHTHWKLREVHWDRTEQPVAAMNSSCRPQLSTPEPDLIFAVGCMKSGGRWFRMLRRDGHPVLKGESPSDEIEQSAEGADGGAFAVRVVKTVRAMSYGQPFKRSDLTQERISVYRGSDGKGVATVNTADFALSETAFALSPEGDQLALMGSSSILFYPVSGSGR